MLVVGTIAKIRRGYFVQKKPIKAIRAGLRNLGLMVNFRALMPAQIQIQGGF